MTVIIRARLAATRAFEEEDGQGLTEYTLILTLIALIAIAALSLLGGSVSSELTKVAGSL